jgi:mono/diheme cytochrome c family protein
MHVLVARQRTNMHVSRERLRTLGRLSLILCNLVVALLLVATGVLIYSESKWATPRFREPADAFRNGTIGTEIMPLPVALVLPGLAPQHFQPAGPEAGDWIDQFGFLRNPDDSHGFPIGFAVSDYRPRTGAPSPVPFVGFSCALCHTTAIKTSETDGARIVSGPGSVSLNIFAWVDALQASLVERQPPAPGRMIDRANPPAYRLTADEMIDAYKRRTGKELHATERLMIRAWLSEVRARIEDVIQRYGDPYGNGLSRNERVAPTGPSRTQPVRALVRELVHRPVVDMKVYSKMATVYSQDWRPRAQFDGSLGDINSRSAFAALAQGATPINLAQPEIAHNIRSANAYTTTLRPPGFTKVFPDLALASEATLARGREVYQAHCFGCHGSRAGPDEWTAGPRTNSIIPLSEIGTDPERVMFRYYAEVPGLTQALFGPRHPFRFERNKIFPLPGEENNLAARGYLAGPLDGAFLRAPYLHNASVLTLAELINLEPRRKVFFRGQNLYDPNRIGFISPPAADAKRYFRFDTSEIGNSNAGHNYPWTYEDPARSEEDLRALLEYLKSL